MSDKFNNIYFIGIGGISMSGLAELMLYEGCSVSGSDRKKSHITDKLTAMGAKVYYEHAALNITNDLELVVYTSAIGNDNPELIRANELNLHIMDRAQFLGYIMKNYENSICISGTHGKTTTTGMTASVLIESDKKPTIFLGGEMDSMGGNLLRGDSNMLLTEACEYKRNFLKFRPTAEVILNIDKDHLDYYNDLDDIKHAFVQFSELLPQSGVLIVNNDDADLFSGLNCSVITFGSDSMADYYPDNISFVPHTSFDLMHKGSKIINIELSVLGMHNILNAVATAALCMFYGISEQTIAAGLNKFKGTHRRYHRMGTFNGAELIDDYAHHPTEMITTLKTARIYTEGKIITAFQPHTFTRTKSLLKEFAEALLHSDIAVLLDIYAARELDTGEVSSLDLIREVEKLGGNSIYADSFESASRIIKEIVEPGDTIITMGAGSINELMDYFK